MTSKAAHTFDVAWLNLPFPRPHLNTKTEFSKISILGGVSKNLDFQWSKTPFTCGRKNQTHRKSYIIINTRVHADVAFFWLNIAVPHPYRLTIRTWATSCCPFMQRTASPHAHRVTHHQTVLYSSVTEERAYSFTFLFCIWMLAVPHCVTVCQSLKHSVVSCPQRNWKLPAVQESRNPHPHPGATWKLSKGAQMALKQMNTEEWRQNEIKLCNYI